MIINLYTFAKRENSTKQPAGSGTQFSCYLKTPTSVIDPVIVIDHADQSAPQMHYFNYAYIPDFNRYYFITDIRSVGHLWEYSMTTDILATYKSAVSAATLYLLRCSSLYDGSVIDEFYPISTDFTTSIEEVSTPWLYSGSEIDVYNKGTFIIGVVADPYSGSYLGSYGSIQYYALSLGGLYSLVHALLQNSTLSNFDANDMSIELQKAIIDPLSFIKSCIWAPGLEYSGMPQTEQATMHIWDWDVSAANKRLSYNPPYANYTINLTMHSHPMAASRGSYLNISPFTKSYISCPPFGVFELDTTLIKGAASVQLAITYDFITGGGILDIYANGLLLSRHKSQIGVPIQLTQVYHDYIGAASGVAGGILGAFGSALTGNIAGVISGGLGAVGSAVNAMKPIQSSIGGNGGFSDLRGKAALYQVFYDPLDEDLAHHGRPLCQNVVMSTVSSGSYCLAMDGDISISGTAGEQTALKAFLEGGFYYE